MKILENNKSKIVLILGHRGYSEIAPENTKLSFDAAHLFGFDGIEIDVHMTKDKKLVVIHDEDIKRTSDGKGKIKNFTLEELLKFNFASKFNKNYPFQKIMTYEEFLERYKDKFKVINVEIKTNVFHYKGIEKLIWDVHQKIKPKAKIIYSSFNFESLVILNDISKEAILGYLFTNKKDLEGKENKIKEICNYIHPWFKSILDKESFQFYKSIGLPMNLWTFDQRKTNDEWSKGSDEVSKTISEIPEVYSLICNSKY